MKFLSLFFFCAVVLNFQTAISQVKYQKPEAQVDDLLRAAPFSNASINRQKTGIIKTFYKEMPSIEYVARPQMKIAGIRFNPTSYTAISNYYIEKLSYFDIKTKKERRLPFAETAIMREVRWSPEGRHVLVSVETEKCQELWLVQIPSLQKSKIPGVCLNSVLGRLVSWVDENTLVFAARTPGQNKTLVMPAQTPKGPVIQESLGQVSQNRTYADLLRTPNDEVAFEQGAQSQIMSFHLKTRELKKIGAAGIYQRVDFSPNKKLILVQKLQRPFSYVVPYFYFSGRTEIWRADGQFLRLVTENKSFENIPIQGVRTGPRSIQWVDDEAQTLFYAQALDQGDWNVKVAHRDELFLAPVASDGAFKAESFLKTVNRFSGFEVLDKSQGYFVYDYEREKEWSTVLWVKKEQNKWTQKTIFSLSENDDYANPGSPVYVRNQMDEVVVAVGSVSPTEIFLSGAGATPEGEKPFLRRMNLQDLKTQEMFRSENGTYESFLGFLDEKTFSKFLTSFETPEVSPRVFVREQSGSELKKDLLYTDPNPYAILSQIKKEMITYKRKDGVVLSGVLYYPFGYKAGEKYPAIIQAYPLEYTDAKTAGQVRGSQYRFEKPFREDVIYHALRGYVVLNDAQMPIIGLPETKNDTFIPQLVSGAKAAVDALDERGLIDRKRVGVVGHSYGAFMVAHLLTHSDLFATGVAKSGAYNRTLTPFGFQGERRPFWKAKETYIKMSPFMDAEKMKKPMLLVHGMADNNSGTFTMQSERYFEALKGQGAHVRLVLLPEESHGYAAVESVGHSLSEMFSWFDTHLGAKIK